MNSRNGKRLDALKITDEGNKSMLNEALSHSTLKLKYKNTDKNKTMETLEVKKDLSKEREES